MATQWIKGKHPRVSFARKVANTKYLLGQSKSTRAESSNSLSSSSRTLESTPEKAGRSPRCSRGRSMAASSNSSPATDITTLDVSICSSQGSSSDKLISYCIGESSPTTPLLEKCPRHRCRRKDGTKKFKLKKVNPRNYDIKFDTASYLHEDRIKEIMNIEHLEKSLDEVLNISSNDMDEMLNCRGLAAYSAESETSFTPVGDTTTSRTTISEDDISVHFVSGPSNHHTSLDNLLSVPELDSIGSIKPEDMDEMLKVNRELIDWEVTEEDIDDLLNIDCYYSTKDNTVKEEWNENEVNEGRTIGDIGMSHKSSEQL